MINTQKLSICFVTALMFSCTSTAEQTGSSLLPEFVFETVTQVQANPQPKSMQDVKLTLKQIMADPDWLGRQPENPGFVPASNLIRYERKREGSVVRDVYVTSVGEGNGALVIDQQRHSFVPDKLRIRSMVKDEYVDDIDKSFVGWIFEGNVFAMDRNSLEIRQLTRDKRNYSAIQYFSDSGFSVQSGNSFFTIDYRTGLLSEILTWKFADKPKPVTPPEDYIAQEQLKLIQYENVQRQNREAQATARDGLHASNTTIPSNDIFLDKSHRLVIASLSPDARWAILATTKNTPNRNDSDIMPDYIEENGRIATKSVRQRVADAQPVSHQLHLVDLSNGQIRELSFKQLPGYNDDVLENVKRENAQRRSQEYVTNRLPRDIRLLFDVYATEHPIKWNPTGNQVAIMLEAWDNKDRWLVSVDPEKPELILQHRLQDEAWIGYRYNQFGWFNTTDSLFLLSEQSGYSHLYVKPLNGPLKALTRGRFVVNNVHLSQDDRFFLFTANQKHPGIYEVYKYDNLTEQMNALTDLNGMTEFAVSPDETMLVLTHSRIAMPPELYTLSLENSESTPQRLTHTVSDAFLSIDWVIPNIVAIPSSNTQQPIYSRVYLPQDNSQEKRRAVVFNHGAGYLQNAHLGWSGYFREFMFHSFLVKQGYVVLDMDFRASAGYGRDWRTAIYRHMGKPEIEDNIDGVNWLVANANVDRDRVGTYGGSYGGFLTFMAMFTQPDLYKAGAALRPVTDWAHYNTPYTSNILNTPDVDPIAYERSSPIYFAEGLQEALLINAPMVDDNVFFVDVVRLVQRLIELEKEDFETAIYPVEPHGFVQPSSWLDEYRRIYKLFEDNL